MGLLGNGPIDYFDLFGLEKRFSGEYPVSGKGHHYVPVELWQKHGFDDDAALSFFDAAVVECPNGHNSQGHGSVTGYTGQVDAEFSKELNAYKNKFKIKGRLNSHQQQAFAKTFVRHIRFRTKNAYIKAFNLIVPEGPDAVKIFYRYAGADLLKPVSKTADHFITKGGRRIPFVKYSVCVTTWTSVFSNQLANGASLTTAQAIATADAFSPLPVGIDDIESVGEKMIDSTQRVLDDIEDGFKSRGNLPDGTNLFD